jgi:hypothetical protein
MAIANAVNANQAGIQGITSGGVWTGTAVTNHAIITGGATSNTLGNVGPDASTGKILQSQGASSDPAFSTATYPSTAGTSGKILISDGTNIVSSTPTYPNAASTALKHIKSDGTNFVTTTVTYPDASVTSGKVIISDGTNYIASTPTFPNSATGTGTILRADGTNWAATTATYPATTTVSRILYSSATNVVGQITTANSGVLTTDSSGVPTIDTTNFVRQTTGMQMKGNNTNTAPPAGFIGEQIRSAIAIGSAVGLTTNTAANVTSISLTAGIWDVSALINFNISGSTAVSTMAASISTTSATRGTAGDNESTFVGVAFTGLGLSLSVPSYRLTLSSTTTVYLVAFAIFVTSTLSAYGRISGTRVG